MKIYSLAILVFLLGSNLQSPLNADPFYINERPFKKSTQEKILPYLLSSDHPIKPILDAIFSASRAIENKDTLIAAGFEIVSIDDRSSSYIVIARHNAVPGYIFKMYLDSEKRSKLKVPHWKALYKRCVGAAKIRKLIIKEKIRYFTVPDKWLYALPKYPLSRETSPEPFILVATDMELEDWNKSEWAWKSLIKRKHLDELYIILSHGYGSVYLLNNVPYTKKGTFAFIDTEHPKRDLRLKAVRKYFSPKMRKYWDKIR